MGPREILILASIHAALIVVICLLVFASEKLEPGVRIVLQRQRFVLYWGDETGNIKSL